MFHLKKSGVMRVDCLPCKYLRLLVKTFFKTILFSYFELKKVGQSKCFVVILVTVISIDSIFYTKDQFHILICIKKCLQTAQRLELFPEFRNIWFHVYR